MRRISQCVLFIMMSSACTGTVTTGPGPQPPAPRPQVVDHREPPPPPPVRPVDPPPPPPAPPHHAPAAHPFRTVAGWTFLGEREVDGKVDHDRIEVADGGDKGGGYDQMGFYVEDSDIEVIDLEVKFGIGKPWHPGLKHYFREGERSRVIDFPGNARKVRYIDFVYRNLAGGGRAKVEVWGFRKGKK